MLDTKLVHVLVHRESEEYNTSDVEDSTPKVEYRRPPEIKISPGSDDIYPSDGGLVPESIVKIMVESPKDPPQVDYYSFPGSESSSAEVQPQVQVAESGSGEEAEACVEGAIRIDVNMPVDKTNLFYEYEEPKQEKSKKQS